MATGGEVFLGVLAGTVLGATGVYLVLEGVPAGVSPAARKGVTDEEHIRNAERQFRSLPKGSVGKQGFMEGYLGKRLYDKYAASHGMRPYGQENPISSTSLVIAGVLALAAVGGIAYVAIRPAAPPPGGQPPPAGLINQPATSLTPGHIYRFSSVVAPGSSPSQVADAIGTLGFANARVWTYPGLQSALAGGDTSLAPADYNWPPETRSNLGVLIEGKWTGPAAPVPKGIFGLIDYAAS